ncbi:hypothetical protein Y032_0014g2251 [Ancylostoma ceylanicum]|uniref:Uncharacterized protein n=1 Tax=Ancylostoma ceylanicum TaxID=53326 RepID=A0A016VB84_9BILA|nr:hypothetical protein Y032_0014g2251 [Ancylostoma ceylanicum]
MGCGSSSQVENVVPAPKAAAEPARPATAANGAAVTRATCGDENPVIATTMDELNVDYTIIRLLLLGWFLLIMGLLPWKCW